VRRPKKSSAAPFPVANRPITSKAIALPLCGGSGAAPRGGSTDASLLLEALLPAAVPSPRLCRCPPVDYRPTVRSDGNKYQQALASFDKLLGARSSIVSTGRCYAPLLATVCLGYHAQPRPVHPLYQTCLLRECAGTAVIGPARACANCHICRSHHSLKTLGGAAT